MDASNTQCDRPSRQLIGGLAAAGALSMWVSQPPWCLWMVAFVAVIPWLVLACRSERLARREYFLIWLAGFVYWAISVQGLRHAHPVIYAGWLALAGYLGIYFALFVLVCRRLLAKRFPLWIAAPVAWVGLELVRNYLLTGISAAMLAHTMADVPMMIQIADVFGSYGVGFVIVVVNVAIFQLCQCSGGKQSIKQSLPAAGLAVVLVTATLVYGRARLQAPAKVEPLATFALIQRNEPVDYAQDQAREQEMFQNYARQSLTAVAAAKRDVDVVVWPESMFSGALPWMMAEPDAVPPAESKLTSDEFQQVIDENRQIFSLRASDVQRAIAATRPSRVVPHLIGGCGVLRYGRDREVYSGIVHVSPDSSRVDWYGKTHLVMIGEYVPLISRIPALSQLVPALTTGPGAKNFSVDHTSVAPNICIETAVERVTVNHLATLNGQQQMPDVVVTVTNDGWFDDSSVIDHHLRCAQLVAVGCRRPVLSAANNGPTAWIDSNGQIVERLTTGSNGAVIATPTRIRRISWYLRLRDWPARVLALLCVYALFPSRRRDEITTNESSPD